MAGNRNSEKTIHLRDVLRSIDPALDTDRAEEAMREVVAKPNVQRRLGWKRVSYSKLPAGDTTEAAVRNLVFLRSILLPKQIDDLCNGNPSRWSYGMRWVQALLSSASVAIRYKEDLDRLFQKEDWLLSEDLLGQALHGKALKTEMFSCVSDQQGRTAGAAGFYHQLRSDQSAESANAENAYELYCAGQIAGAKQIADVCLSRNPDDGMALFVKALLLFGESQKHAKDAWSAGVMAEATDGMTQDSMEWEAELASGQAAVMAAEAVGLTAKALDNWPVRGGWPELRSHRERATMVLLDAMYSRSVADWADTSGQIASEAMRATTLRLLKESESSRTYGFSSWAMWKKDLIWLELYLRLSEPDYKRYAAEWLGRVVSGDWHPDDPWSLANVVVRHLGILVPDFDRRTELMDRIRTSWLRWHDLEWSRQQWELYLDEIRVLHEDKQFEMALGVVRRARHLIWENCDRLSRDPGKRQYLHLRLLYDAAKAIAESDPNQAAEYLLDTRFYTENLWKHFTASSRSSYLECDDEDYQEYSDVLGNADDIVNRLGDENDEKADAALVVLARTLHADTRVAEHARKSLAWMLQQARDAGQA